MNPHIKRLMRAATLGKQVKDTIKRHNNYGPSLFRAHIAILCRELTLTSLRGGNSCPHDAANRTLIIPTPYVDPYTAA